MKIRLSEIISCLVVFAVFYTVGNIAEDFKSYYLGIIVVIASMFLSIFLTPFLKGLFKEENK